METCSYFQFFGNLQLFPIFWKLSVISKFLEEITANGFWLLFRVKASVSAHGTRRLCQFCSDLLVIKTKHIFSSEKKGKHWLLLLVFLSDSQEAAFPFTMNKRFWVMAHYWYKENLFRCGQLIDGVNKFRAFSGPNGTNDCLLSSTYTMICEFALYFILLADSKERLLSLWPGRGKGTCVWKSLNWFNYFIKFQRSIYLIFGSWGCCRDSVWATLWWQ